MELRLPRERLAARRVNRAVVGEHRDELRDSACPRLGLLQGLHPVQDCVSIGSVDEAKERRCTPVLRESVREIRRDRGRPRGGTLPPSSTINYSAGQTRANNSVLTLGTSGDFVIHSGQATGTVQVIVDINGYFTVAEKPSRRGRRRKEIRPPVPRKGRSGPSLARAVPW
jgi:hypothetical protein